MWWLSANVFLRQQDLLTAYKQTILLLSACSWIKAIREKDYGYWVTLFIYNEFTQSIGFCRINLLSIRRVWLCVYRKMYIQTKNASLCKFCVMAGVIQAMISGQIRKKKALKILRFSFENASFENASLQFRKRLLMEKLKKYLLHVSCGERH